MTKARRKIARDVEADVLVMCRRRCCICYGLDHDLTIKSGQIAHLDGDPTNNRLESLCFLCLRHHDQYDTTTSQSKGLTSHEVRRFRKELHEVIETAWKQPALRESISGRTPAGVAGRYVRETEYESAELKVETLEDERVRVTGLALWGTRRGYGPNIGELEFEGAIADNEVRFVDQTPDAQEYRLALLFHGDGVTAREQYVVGYFGMNVSFEGEYRRVEAVAAPQEIFEGILLRVLPEILTVTGTRLDEIGLHVWLSEPWLADAAPGELRRAARVRLSDATPSRPRGWRRSEGVVGLCWERQTDVAVNLTDPHYREASATVWDDYPSDVTLGMTFDEFVETTRHFKVVSASPIVPANVAVGCASLNFDVDCEADYDMLWSDDVKRLLRRAAEDVAVVLRVMT